MRSTLYFRLSIIFLAFLFVLAFISTGITTLTANKYFNETTQKLYANVAQHMLLEVQPFIGDEINEEALGVIMHSMMAVNPSLEVYLLDPTGEILSYVVLEKNVKLKKVSIDPIKDFLKFKGENLVLGDDPRNPAESSIFSAAPVYQNNELKGYVYMILVSEKVESISKTLFGSYALVLGAKLLVITLFFAFLIGLALIWLLTKNLRIIINTFKKFEKGDLAARVPENKTKGELKILSKTYNSMADTILKNIEELKEVDTLRRELIANVSHDLRNPMAIIHGYIETLIIKEETITKVERDKYLKIILKTSEKLKNLVADLFELSKLETGHIKLKKEAFSMNELLIDSSKSFEVLAQQKNILINKNIAEVAPKVYADIALIDKAIQNLLDNAIKYTPENGTIDIELNILSSELEISIKNTGKGIPEKDLPFIFDRYYKINKENLNIDGTGLGLAITKRIIDVHNSKIKVDSENNGQTTFSFTLPQYAS